MSDKKRKSARQAAAVRNTGKRKSAKIDDENIPPVNNPRARPKPVRKHASGDAFGEEAAAAALMAMGSASGPVLMERIPATDSDNVINASDNITVEDDKPLSVKDSDEEYEEDTDRNADSDGEEQLDDELDAAIAQLIPTVTIPAKFSIPFEVPYKNGTRDLTGITSRTDFDDFLIAAAAKMDTRISLMTNIAYIPSYKPRNPKPLPKLLADEEAWDVLIADVHQFIKASRAKNRGKGEVPSFSILIVDLSKSEVEKTGARKKAKKTKKNEKDNDETQAPALKEHELFKKIEEKNYCQACRAPCVVLDSGDHHVLTHTELATWALLASRHQAVISEPPKELNLDAGHARQRRAKTHLASASPNTGDPLAWMQALSPLLGAVLANRAPTQAPPAPGFWQPTSHENVIPAAPPAGGDPRSLYTHSNEAQDAFLGTKRRASEEFPSPDICPDIGTWLANLDSDPIRGRMKLNYMQYSDLLINDGFFELSDLTNVSADKLLSLPGGDQMNFGIANRLVTYAKEDFELRSTKRPRVD
ncbi:hypothetical protein FB451DRAFT_1411735 [Mycena latifolia]|nr:hypothetical protein FB451DRAFT_1411735 [Mycena latifolia]